MEALSRRLQRVYLPLFTVLLLAWVFRITAFVPGETWLRTAALPGVPGTVVVGVVALFYVTAVGLTFLPGSRDAKGEFHGEEAGDWKKAN